MQPLKTLMCVFVAAVVALMVSCPACARGQDPGADRIMLITDDVTRFWQAYDLWRTSEHGDPAALAAVLQAHYIDPGSSGLKAFIPGRIVSADNLAKAILADSKYYEEMRPITGTLAGQAPQLEAMAKELLKIDPQTTMPTVYLVIGARSSGGTSTTAGLVIGAEMFSPRPKSRLHPEDFVSLATHELIHYQQARTRERLKETDSLLRMAMVEGAADYFAERLTGHHIDEAAKPYADSHEEALWQAFRADMNHQGPDGWLYNGNSVPDGTPPDLGYYVGYKICQAFIDHAANKPAALSELLSLADERAILRESHYADRFK